MSLDQRFKRCALRCSDVSCRRGSRPRPFQHLLGEEVEVSDQAGHRGAKLVRRDGDELAPQAHQPVEIHVLAPELRLRLGERARALADDQVQVLGEAAQLGVDVLEGRRLVLELLHPRGEELRQPRRYLGQGVLGLPARLGPRWTVSSAASSRRRAAASCASSSAMRASAAPSPSSSRLSIEFLAPSSLIRLPELRRTA
jgi:hypothetical protein